MLETVLIDRYRLTSVLGSGGMSTVYLAHDATLDREVAVKVLHREVAQDDGQLERFRREARQVASLSHPNIVPVIDAGEDEGGHPFIVFQYVRGETLKQRIRRSDRLAVPEAVAYAIEIALGLGAAHASGIIHRDVKPQNVLLDEEGRAQITDFGIARSLGTEGLTATGRVLGTTDYVSPEQALGHEVDGRSDIYSLGICLWEMLTGNVPFTGETPVAVAMKHVREAVPDVQRLRPEVSAALAGVVDRAIVKEPEERYPDTTALIEDLQQALEVEAARAGSTTGEATAVLDAVQKDRKQRRTGRRWPLATVGLAVVVALVAGVVVAVGDREQTPPPVIDRPGPQPESVELTAEDLSDYDPDGDEGEHPDELALAVDGDPTGTAWTTENYVQRDMGKSGVGVFVDLGEPADVRAVRISSEQPGWSFELRGAPGPDPPAEASGWALLESVVGADDVEEIEIAPQRRPMRYYLVWITEPTESPTGRGFRVGISNLEIFS